MCSVTWWLPRDRDPPTKAKGPNRKALLRFFAEISAPPKTDNSQPKPTRFRSVSVRESALPEESDPECSRPT